MSEENVDSVVVTTKKRNSVTPETFVSTWQTSETRKEVAEKLHMQYNAVIARERSYRKSGVPLKELVTGNKGRAKRLNIEALKSICVSE